MGENAGTARFRTQLHFGPLAPTFRYKLEGSKILSDSMFIRVRSSQMRLEFHFKCAISDR